MVGVSLNPMHNPFDSVLQRIGLNPESTSTKRTGNEIGHYLGNTEKFCKVVRGDRNPASCYTPDEKGDEAQRASSPELYFLKEKETRNGNAITVYFLAA